VTRPGFGTFLATIGVLSATLAASALSERRKFSELALPLENLPRSLAGWDYAEDAPLPPRALKRLEATDHCSRLYVKSRVQLGLFVAYYAQQRSGESMHSPKHCLPGSGWEIWQYGSIAVPLNHGSVNVNRYSIHKGDTRAIVLYWYQSHDRILASEYLGKVWLMRDALWDGRTDGAIVRIVLPDSPEAVSEGVAFASQLIPAVQRCFSRQEIKDSHT
jgi:EpsI family protein